MSRIINYKYVIQPHKSMHVPVVIYTTEKLFNLLFKDKAVEQLKNVATLPGIVHFALGMPDIHEGYGFPIGGVAAFDIKEGVVSPGGVGFDINCGVRVILTQLSAKEIKGLLPKIGELIYNTVPSGLGSTGKEKFSKKEMKALLRNGVYWAVENGFGVKEDIEVIEENGMMKNAEPGLVSEESIKRGRVELGTLGAGNHFLEIDYIDKIFNVEVANIFGLFEGQVVVWIHTGSRGFGHQVAKEYINLFRNKMPKYGIPLIDRDLVSLPISSPEAEQYLRAMAAAANFAWVNRQIITHYVRLAFSQIFKTSPHRLGMNLLYDVAHNIAKFERYNIDGEEKLLLVHRKGATRAFPKGHSAIPDKYRSVGQPVLLPGDMRSGSYILVGKENSLSETFGSVAHGAGRVLSRHKALKEIAFDKVQYEMEQSGIILLSADRRIIREEAPEAYKNVDEVIVPIEKNNLAERVAHSRPLLVIKG
jgi:tRNA-splicing ligase RtcB